MTILLISTGLAVGGLRSRFRQSRVKRPMSAARGRDI
jgi:hypothetical protein